MAPGSTRVKTINVGKNESIIRDEWFPESNVPMCLDLFECWTTQDKTGYMDYYVVFFDGHDNGAPNPIAKWIANVLPSGVNPTGHFVIAHKVFDDDGERNAHMDKTLKELQKLFK